MQERFKTIIILRNDSSANWLANPNALLQRGEVGLEFLDNGNVKMKIGDGIRVWTTLPYFGGEAADVSEAIAQLEAQVGKLNTDILALVTSMTAVENNLQDVYTKTEVDSLLSSIYRVKGSVNTVAELPTNPAIGDVYNVISADIATGINAGDNVVWTGQAWDRLGGSVDLTAYTLKSDFNKLAATTKKIKYEVMTLPKGAQVDYDREKEIRVFCPKDTVWTFQTPGATGNPNMHYMQFRAYAPEGAVSFKEDDKDHIEDDTMYYFDDDFAGIDQYGRKYSVLWLALANYNDATQTWTYYGKNSSVKKFIGWFYSVEWYDENGQIIGSDTIRINLTNEDCHTAIEPYYMGSIDIEKLVQKDGHELILNSGTALI